MGYSSLFVGYHDTVMKMLSASLGHIRFIAILVLSLGLMACAIPLPDWQQDTTPVYVIPLRLEPEPVVSTQFTLPSADNNVVGQVQMVTARYQDTLSDIARRFKLGYEEITQANPQVDPLLPGAGTLVLLPTQFVLPDAPREGIVLNLANMRLFYYPKPQGSESPVVRTFPIGIGRIGWSTPIGRTKVVSKRKNPSWHVPASIRKEHAQMGDPLPAVVRAGPNNPLGQFAIRLNIPGYLIHGTNKPDGVGMRVSHGCIRLYPEDIKALYPQIPVGTPVHIVNQPILAGWLNGEPYLEVHKPFEDHPGDWNTELGSLLNGVLSENQRSRTAIDWEKAAQLLRDPPGFPIPIATGSPYPQDIRSGSGLVVVQKAEL